MRAFSDLVRNFSGRALLFVVTRLWDFLPTSVRRRSSGQGVGSCLHAVTRRFQARTQNHSTFFFRNRPELKLMTRIAGRLNYGSALNILVLGCSKGAEVYSIAYAIRSARPDLKLQIHAVDISDEILAFARTGCYSLAGVDEPTSDAGTNRTERDHLTLSTRRDQTSISIFDRMTRREIASMFDIADGQADIKAWLKRDVSWHCGDATNPELVEILGPQDIVVANRFLCHMDPYAAERCLRGIARLVRPGGHLFVSGVDLDVRTKLAREMMWAPVPDLLQEIYEGDASLTSGWPTAYWACEPFQFGRRDFRIRYASVFQL